MEVQSTVVEKLNFVGFEGSAGQCKVHDMEIAEFLGRLNVALVHVKLAFCMAEEVPHAAQPATF